MRVIIQGIMRPPGVGLKFPRFDPCPSFSSVIGPENEDFGHAADTTKDDSFLANNINA